MQCPNCDGTLKTVHYEGIEIETCPSCHGEWLDAQELRHVVKARQMKFDEEERRAVAAAVQITPVKVELHDRDLKCPKCGGQTDTLNYGGDSGLLIDKCTSCSGVWLDANELEKVQMIVEGWEDGLPADLKKYGARLRQVAADVEERTRFDLASLPFMNAIVNGVLGWVD